MKTSHKIIIPVFSVLLAGAIALVVLTMNGTLKRKPETSGETENGVYTSTDFTQLKPTSVQSQYPLMKTDFDSVFYCAGPDGAIKFYEFDGEKAVDYQGVVKTITVTPELTYNKVSITISYIEKDGKTLGYGIFTNKNNPEVTLYSYVFAKLIDAPEIYGIKGKMLLLNIDADEAYSNNKAYVEIFSVDMTNGALSRVFSQRDRVADKTGKFTDRWHILTDEFLKSAQKKAAVISGRLYNDNTEIYDIFDLNRSMNTPDVSGIYGTFLRENPEDNSYVYLKKTTTGFKSVSYLGQETELTRFDGDLENDFVFSGDWVYSVKERAFTNLVNKTKITANGVEAIDMFAVSPDGTKFICTANYKDSQAFFVVNKDGEVTGYSGKNIFNSNIKNMCFADSETVIMTALNEDNACTNYFVKIK